VSAPSCPASKSKGQGARHRELRHALLGARTRTVGGSRRAAAAGGRCPVGEDIRRHLDLDDHLITLKLTPNRADCLSLLGIARELSALTGAAMLAPEVKPVAAVD
jgi:hypothetical protein